MDAIESIKKEGFRRKLSIRTIKTYCDCVKRFLKFCNKEPKKITKKDVREYIEFLADKGGSGNTLNVYLNAIKFLIEQIMFKRWKLNIKYSKASKKLPIILSKSDVLKLISAIENPTHKLMISMMYASGLRVSELINLKIKDLELDECYGWVRQGKGNKDRLFIIPEKLVEDLKEITKNKELNSYIFKSNRKTHYSKESLYQIVKKAAKIASINKNVHPHTLRHSFATHLIENGYCVSSIQPLLGHNSAETTMIYLHTAPVKMISVKSPFDNIS